jgi:hypothetical protein
MFTIIIIYPHPTAPDHGLRKLAYICASGQKKQAKKPNTENQVSRRKTLKTKDLRKNTPLSSQDESGVRTLS